MASRLELHEKLCSALGSRNVYFQPPESMQLRYPCIVYELSDIDVKYANDKGYLLYDRYTITVISKDPDLGLARDILKEYPLCSFDRQFVTDNLNHSVLSLYF